MMMKSSLGAGSIINGRILHGATAFAGEILHLHYPEGNAREILTQKGGAVTIAANLVVSYSVILNPAVIVFTGMTRSHLHTTNKEAS